MNILKQSTAATIKLGPFVDDTDGKTAETGLTISQADIRLSKNGGDFAQTNSSAGATHDELGYYDIPLDTTDTNTLGRLLVAVHESGALPVWQEFLVVTANVYDTLCSTDKLDVAVVEMATDVLTAASVKADAVTKIQNGLATPTNITAGTITTVTNLTNLPTMPTDWLTAAGLKADAVTKIQSGLALEATLTAIKGAGWTNDTLKSIGAAVAGITDAVDLIDDDLVDGGRLDLLIDSIITHLTDIKGTGWTNETLVKIVTDIAAISAGSGAMAQEVWEYATRVLTAGTNIDLSALATAADLATLDGKADAILEDTGTTIPATLGTLATTAHVQEVEDIVDRVDAVADAIKAKTDQLTFTVANKVDATATTDTSSVAGDVWSHPHRTLTNQGLTVTTPATGDPLEIYRDTTVTISLTGLGATTGYTKIWFTVKEDLEDLDTAAVLQVSTIDGLKYLDGATGMGTDGTLVIDNDLHTATITIQQASAALLPVYAAYPIPWDLKMLNASVVSILAEGTMYIKSTPTRTIS